LNHEPNVIMTPMAKKASTKKSPQQIKQKWLDIAFDCETEDDAAVEKAIAKIYKLHGEDPPAIFWCDNPFIPNVLITFLNMSPFKRMCKELESFDFSDKKGSITLDEAREAFQKEIPIGKFDTILADCINFWVNKYDLRTSQGRKLYADAMRFMTLDAVLPIGNDPELEGKKSYDWQRPKGPLQMEMDPMLWTQFLKVMQKDLDIQKDGSIPVKIGDFDLFEELLELLWQHILDGLNRAFQEPLRLQLINHCYDRFSEILDEAVGHFKKGAITIPFKMQFLVGQMSASRLAQYDLSKAEGATFDKEKQSVIKIMEDLCKYTSLVYPFQNFCMVLRKPIEINLNDNHQIHCEDGPAIEYRDGYRIWALDGRVVPEWMVKEEPKEMSYDAIKTIKDKAVQNIALKKFKRNTKNRHMVNKIEQLRYGVS